jgi:hypothetical protein
MPAIVHVNRRLTDVSLHYPYEFESIGDFFFPIKPVEYLSDQFVTANKPNLLSIRDAAPLGDDDVPPNVELVWDADTTFSCKVYGLSSPGKWITQKNADPALDYETERTIQLTNSLRLRLEYLKVKQRLRDTSTMTSYSTLTAAQRFDNYSSGSSTPITTIKTIVANIGYANGGKRPNRMAMTSHVLNAICNSEEFKDKVKYTVIPSGMSGPDAPTGPLSQVTLVEAMVGIPFGSLRIADHVYNSAASNQTASYKTFIGSDIVIGYVEPLGLRSWSMSAGFQWSAYPGAPTSIISVPQYNRGVVATEELRAFTVIDPKVIKPELGYLLKGCVDVTNSIYGGLLD